MSFREPADLAYRCPDQGRLDGYVASLRGPVPPGADDAARAMVEQRLAPVNVEPDAADLLHVLTRATNPSLVVEIGTLAGYSTAYIRAGMAPGGRLITIESDSKSARIARDVLTSDDPGPSVEVLEGSALELLEAHVEAGTVDLMFIDGSKAEYPAYLKLAHRLLRIGGLLIADDSFAFGRIAEPDLSEGFERAVATPIRTFNHVIFNSPLFRSAIVPTRQGLSLSVRLG